MKSTGIVRRVDDLGRIVLPRELRKLLDINEKDELEIFTKGSSIVLQKHQPNCIFCGGASGVELFKNKNICQSCLKELSSKNK